MINVRCKVGIIIVDLEVNDDDETGRGKHEPKGRQNAVHHSQSVAREARVGGVRPHA